jgi:hypothetical protein
VCRQKPRQEKKNEEEQRGKPQPKEFNRVRLRKSYGGQGFQ